MRRFFENIKIAFQSLILNKLRFFLTILGIIIGVSAVIAVMAVGTGAQSSIVSNIRDAGTNIITISPGREGSSGGGGRPAQFGNSEEETVAGELTYEDYQVLKKQAALFNDFAPLLTKQSRISYGGYSSSISITASTENILDIYNYGISKGEMFTDNDVANAANVAVIGSQIAEDFFGRINPVGETIKIESRNFEIIGVLESLGAGLMGMNQDEVIYIPITTAQSKLYGGDTLSTIIGEVESEDKINSAMEEVEDIMMLQHEILPDAPKDFTINSATQMVEMINEVTNTFVVTLAAIAAISLLVGGIGIMNIMLVSVTERTREIGIRKAIGAKNKDILVQFLTESIVLSITGGIMGVLFALLIVKVIELTGLMTAIVTASPVIMSLTFSIMIGLLFGIMPAMRAAKLNPIQSLRHE
jgi:putative ABC transport system permease protein